MCSPIQITNSKGTLGLTNAELFAKTRQHIINSRGRAVNQVLYLKALLIQLATIDITALPELKKYM